MINLIDEGERLKTRRLNASQNAIEQGRNPKMSAEAAGRELETRAARGTSAVSNEHGDGGDFWTIRPSGHSLTTKEEHVDLQTPTMLSWEQVRSSRAFLDGSAVIDLKSPAIAVAEAFFVYAGYRVVAIAEAFGTALF